ncbi:MAG: NADH-quinone oxidoreductase subunit M [Candidatus Eremiobacteraeota bacterium]|nr:NADH-quinone oxidoreductase subunit M [Candidatus Eremiobacteraeota bacterium]
MIAALVVVPIVVGLALLLLPRSAGATAKWIGVAVAFAAFLLCATEYGAADESVRWLQRPFMANFHVGLGTGPGYWIVLLLTLTTGCALVVTRLPRMRDFVVQMLVLLGAMTGVFVARDLMLFALFWDLMLIPVFLTLIAWSPTKTAGTAWKYLVYNLVGGLALLLATAAYGIVQGTTDVLGASPGSLATISDAWSFWIFAGFAFAFLIKTPVWPFHTWMPDTYADLPAPMAAVVSAVQSKAGLYGFIVVGLALFPQAMRAAVPLMFGLGLIGLVYGALAALVQNDTKRVVAYSSLSHLGLIVLAIFSFNPIALGGAVVYIVAHGLFSAGLFVMLGEVEAREDTRLLNRLGGLGTRNPRLAGGLTIVSLAALGLPGLCGFAGEILILTGLYQAGYVWQTIVALVPIVIAAAYMLRVFQGVMQGPEVDDLPQREDMSLLEILALAPLVVAIVLLGVNPGPVASSLAKQHATVSFHPSNPVTGQ